MKHLKLYNIEWIEQHKAFKKRLTDQGRSISGINNLSDRLNEFFHFLEQQQVETPKQITQQVILDYYSYLDTRPNLITGVGLSSSYIGKHGEAVLRFMEMLTNKAIGESDYHFPITYEACREVEVLTLNEVEDVYNATDNTLWGISNRMIMAMLYGCGLRSGELATLEINDIDFLKREIRLDNTKTRHERDVPIAPSVMKYLEEYLYNARNLLLPQHSTETYVMINLRGTPMITSTISSRVKDMMQAAGITKNMPPHSLRHSIGTHLLGDFTLEEIAEFLGHKDLKSTQIYTHLKETIA